MKPEPNTETAKTVQTGSDQAVAPAATCSACGMLVGLHRNYHPHAACLMFRGCHNGNTVDSNLRAVVEYGMKAQTAGVSLGKAMDDITWRNCLPNDQGEAQPPAKITPERTDGGCTPIVPDDSPCLPND